MGSIRFPRLHLSDSTHPSPMNHNGIFLASADICAPQKLHMRRGAKLVVLFFIEHKGIAITLQAFSLAKQVRLLLHNPPVLLCQRQGDERLLPFAAFAFSFSSSSFSELSELLTGSGTLIFSGMAASSSLTFLLLEFEGVLRKWNLHQNGEKRYLEQIGKQLLIHSQVSLQLKDMQCHSSTAPKGVGEILL